MTVWTPDTDNCQIEISDVDGSFVRFVPGKESKVHPTPNDVVTENRRKNAIYSDVEATLGAGANFSWSINPSDRVVEITLGTGAEAKRGQLVTLMQQKHAGKARVK